MSYLVRRMVQNVSRGAYGHFGSDGMRCRSIVVDPVARGGVCDHGSVRKSTELDVILHVCCYRWRPPCPLWSGEWFRVFDTMRMDTLEAMVCVVGDSVRSESLWLRAGP